MAVNQDFKKKVEEIKYKFGINQSQIAERLGIKPTYLSDMINGRVAYNENFDNKLKEVFNISLYNKYEQYSYLNRDEMQKDEKETLSAKDGTNYLLVPIVHIDSVGGMHSNNSITGEPQYIEGYVPFVNAREGDRAIFQSGTSMIPTIPPGSIMQIREVVNWKEFFGYGNIFVIELKDGRRITKEVRRYDENPREYVWCVSHNPEVQDEELPKSMITSVWKVIKVLTDKGW